MERWPAEDGGDIATIPFCHKNKSNGDASTVEYQILSQQHKKTNLDPSRKKEESKQRKAHTGEIETKLRRKEFELRNADMKLISEGSCSAFHALLIIQTPAAFPVN